MARNGYGTRWMPQSRADAVAFALERILTEEIKNFADLCVATDSWPDGPLKLAAMETGFSLIKKLHWGYFQTLDPERFPRLWAELVLPDPHWDFAGELKRSISLPNLFVGLVDLHGYTKFCRDNRRNLSRLTQLDSLIQDDVPKVIERTGVLARRVRGDEILLIGASAADLLEATLTVVEYFREEKYARVNGGAFPRFELAAGIAGGQGFTALVVTDDGDLSGDAVNTAARLQSRAGRVSPDRTRIMITNHVHRKLKTETATREDRAKYRLLSQIEFVNAGKVEFKGLSVVVHDAVFMDGHDARRISYRKALENLYEAIDAGLWKSRVFEDAVQLGDMIAAAEGGSVAVEARARARAASSAFTLERYEEALTEFRRLVDALAESDAVDHLALEYLRSVDRCYERVRQAYGEALDAETEESLSTMFPEKDRANYRMLQTHYAMFSKVRDAARLRVRNRKALWYRIADREAPCLEVRVGEPK